MESDTLDDFRQKWKDELGVRKTPPIQGDNFFNDEDIEKSDNDKAREFFKQGIEHEKTGDMARAVSCYRQAVKLNPDVETEWRVPRNKKKVQKSSAIQTGTSHRFSEQLFRKIEEAGARFIADRGKSALIEMLPPEIIIKIVEHAAGEELDFHTLESISLSSAAFYIYANDGQLWKRFFERSTNTDASTMYTSSWRSLFMSTPHVYFNGFYSSKIAYVRHGEASFQDTNYMPWQTVVYYRALKLFSNREVRYLITSEHPRSFDEPLNSARSENALRVCHGNWMIKDDVLMAVVHRTSSEKPKKARATKKGKKQGTIEYGIARQTFTLEFKIFQGENRRCGLYWTKNELEIEYDDGRTSKTEFEVDNSEQYPPLSFYRHAGARKTEIEDQDKFTEQF